MRRLFALLCLPLILFSCKSSRKTVMLDDVTVSATNSRYRATATLEWDIVHTDVSLSFDYAARTANGRAIIDLHPYFYPSDKIVLDAKSMELQSVLVNGQKAKLNYDSDSLTIYLDKKHHRTDTVQLTIEYTAQPYKEPTGGSKAISEDRGLYFINHDGTVPTKPVQIWTQGETEANSHWVPTIDKPNERFTTHIHLIVPDSFITLGNGIWTGSATNSDGTRTDSWEMDKNIQPYVMMFAIGKFKVVQDEPWKGKKISYYVEPEYEHYAKDMFRNTPEMVDFFSEVTGVPYPWNKYSQVVVRDYVSGAMENTTATVFGEFINQTTREIYDKDYEDIVSHELFHQWFGDYVTAESWSNLTVNESFATYGEQLWRKFKYGEASRQRLAFNDLNLYLGQAPQNDDPLVRFHYNAREDMFDRISYQKGAIILYYLHGLMGDSAFYKAMNLYLTENALQPAEAHHWRLAVEKVTGKDWNWFFNQWYYRGGHPVLEVKYDFDDAEKKVRITLTQKQAELHRLPLWIKVAGDNYSFSDMVDIDARTVTMTYPYHTTQRPAVLIDTAHWLPGVIDDVKTNEHWLGHYTMCGAEDYTGKVHALRATSGKLDNARIVELYKLALQDSLEFVRVYALERLEQQKNKATQTMFALTVRQMAMKDPSHHARAAALNVLATWRVDSAQAEMHHAIHDYSYKVAAAGLKGLYEMHRDTARNIARHLLTTTPGGDLLPAIWLVIAEQGKAGDTAIFSKARYEVGGDEKMDLAAALDLYMQNAESDRAFKVALEAAEYLALSESIGPYREAITSFLFSTSYYYKEQVAGNSKKAITTKASDRMNQLRTAIINITNKETNEENKAEYNQYRKLIFGEK